MAEFDELSQQFTEENNRNAFVEKLGNAVPGQASVFNPFNIFRYSKFGVNTQAYRSDLHLDKNGPTESLDQAGIALQGVSQSTDNIPSIGNFQLVDESVSKTIQNPSASVIIDWANAKASNKGASASGPTPYNPFDFLHCKWYGKVPNNRLVTLRRYPIPVEDNVTISSKKMPLVPIAQAITWYGSDIGNPISQVLNLGWGFNWSPISNEEVQDIQGNEVSVEDLLAALGQSDLDENVIATIKNILSDGGRVSLAKLSGVDSKFNEYIKGAFDGSGPYWNRILGPVNVVTKTQQRTRGYQNGVLNKPIKLKFEYSLRSYAGINPKIAFLDLLTNFLSLTYNTAPFWGGGARYFEREGVTIPSLNFESKFFEGDVFGGIKEGLKEINELGKSRFQEIINAAQKLVNENGNTAVTSDSPDLISEKKQIDQRAQTSVIERAFAPRLGILLQRPLSYRALLDGRAVGEWHVTIGNPMNPIAHIGNLCLDTVDMEVGENLGIDDFPTDFTFTVSLKHGRQRAKQDIESIFNSGNGRMGFSELPAPSSAFNSFGELNTARGIAATEGLSVEGAVDQLNNPDADGIGTDPVAIATADLARGEVLAPGGSEAIEYASLSGAQSEGVNAATGRGDDLDPAKLEGYRNRVTSHYGKPWGESPILADYFAEVKTKD